MAISSVDRIIMVRPNGVFVELTDQAAATRELLCNDLALNPFQDPDFLAAVLDCINEWKDAVNGGVYGRSGEPLEPEYGGDSMNKNLCSIFYYKSHLVIKSLFRIL